MFRAIRSRILCLTRNLRELWEAIQASPNQLAKGGNDMSALASCTIRFHTNDEDKDGDTHVTVKVMDRGNRIVASISDDFGHFDDGSESGPFDLDLQELVERK